MKKLSFGAIKEKMDDVTVKGQACEPDYDCLHDCKRSYWVGQTSVFNPSCYKVYHYDAYWSVCY